jgi:molybdenum cofactor synthesis domain-containing protein
MKSHLFGRLTPALEARRRLLRAVVPIARTEEVRLASALGRVPARALRATAPVPRFDRASWDGYAVRSADTLRAGIRHPVELGIVGEVFAEQSYPRRLRAGEAVAIATGGAVPRGADAVEIFEEVDVRGRSVRLRAPVRRGARIAPAGDDFGRGELLVRPGVPLGPAELAAAAAGGYDRLRVYERPVVSIVPNGNELRLPGGRLGPGMIYESNNAALSAVVTACGGLPRPVAPVRDDPGEIEAALRSALRSSDLVLATGGSSVGEHDHLPHVFGRLGRTLFHGVAVRPGKPTLAATSGGKLLVGLPGHPTSCLLNMHWLMLPVLRRLAGLPGPGWTETTAHLTAPALAPTPGFTTVVPLRLRGSSATPTFHGSPAISSLREAGAYALLPPGTPTAATGRRLTVFVLDPPLGRWAGRG